MRRSPSSKRAAELLPALLDAGSGRQVDLALAEETVRAALRARSCRLEPVSGSPGPGRHVPLLHADIPVGWLAVDLPLRSRLRPANRRLLRDLAGVLALLVHLAGEQQEVARETATAHAHAEAIAAIRRRAVVDQDEERVALERNLHDGAQHHLVALRLTLGLLEHDLARGAVEAARWRLRRLADLLELTERGLATTAAGALPPSLLAAGVSVALRAELATTPQVRIESDLTDRRYPLPVEVAVFFACLEAVNNARKHAPRATVVVRLSHTYRGVVFRVADDGPGFDPSSLSPRSSLHGLAERINAAGGRLVPRSRPGAGTTIDGFIPV